MSNTLTVSPVSAKIKTRNAILRMKKCSPKLKTVLRQSNSNSAKLTCHSKSSKSFQRCQERIHNERFKILSKIRKMQIQESLLSAFGNILSEEWKNIEDDELCEEMMNESHSSVPSEEFNLDDELLLEELLEKELLSEHEDWLLQQYEEILSEDLTDSNEVVCPLCCLGFLKIKEFNEFKVTDCTKCSANFSINRSLFDLKTLIYDCLERHDNQCEYNPSFVIVPKNESENDLCCICHQCSFISLIV